MQMNYTGMIEKFCFSFDIGVFALEKYQPLLTTYLADSLGFCCRTLGENT